FKALLLSRGFQLRIAPKGTLPFDTDATIADAPGVLRVLRAMPDVAVVSPVLGGQLHVVARDATITATAIANEPAVQGDYDILAGRAPAGPNELVASDAFIRAAGARLGDTLAAAAGFDAELRAFTGQRKLVLVGRARFVYLPADQRAVSLPIGTLSAMQGTLPDVRVSLVMAKARDGADVDALLARVQAALPQVSVTSIQSAMRQVDQRLSYFRQLSLILGAASLPVGFLLVATLVTVSANERIGDETHRAENQRQLPEIAQPLIDLPHRRLDRRHAHLRQRRLHTRQKRVDVGAVPRFGHDERDARIGKRALHRAQRADRQRHRALVRRQIHEPRATDEDELALAGERAKLGVEPGGGGE